jgi:hypothetical protein
MDYLAQALQALHDLREQHDRGNVEQLTALQKLQEVVDAAGIEDSSVQAALRDLKATIVRDGVIASLLRR